MSLYVDITKRLKGFSLQVKFDWEKERLGLLGPSGCGKSMTLKCIAGIERPDRGRIVLNGRVLFDSEEKKELSPQKRRIGYLFQNYALFPNMTVEENIGCGLKGTKIKKKERVEQMLEMFHLQGLDKSYPVQLSGGQQQRVALARILAYEPDVLLLDEPFSALDAYLKEKLQEELLSLLKKYSGHTIIVSHSQDEIYSLCENIAIMDEGKLLLTGKTIDVFKNPLKLEAARLTGCKNISRAKKTGEYKVEALEWGVRLCTKNRVTENIRYIGIRAHDIQPAKELAGENVVPCRPVRVIDSPFEKNIIIRTASYELWWKISKSYWNCILNETMPEYIQLPKEALMLLE